MLRSIRIVCALLLCVVALLCTRAAKAADAPSVRRVTVKVLMRDGVLLATDIYYASQGDKLPVLLMRTPYNKDGGKAAAERYAAAGYVAVVQDCRGRFQSEGDFVPYNNEGQDGYDTIEWIGRQPWCNGRIGTWGASYVGAVQWQAAAENPPGLVTMAPTATWSSFYRNLYLGGAVRLSLITQWAASQAKPANVAAPSDWDNTFLHLPLSDIDRKIGWPIPWLGGMLTHAEPSGYWHRLDLSDEALDLKLPMQHVVGYYDFFSRESVDNFVLMHDKARDPETRRNQQLILGPWDHGTIGKSQVGELDFGNNAVVDATGENLKWFDRTMKQEKAAEPFAAVRYFSMGNNEWKEADNWPPPGTTPTSFYLHSKGHANTASGDGTIDQQTPDAQEPADSFRADPANPTPACPVTSSRPLSAPVWAPVDQRATEDRKDVVVYTSQPLEVPLTFAGNPTAELYVSADTPDADWVVKLVDVHPDGAAYNLAVGIQRARFRESLTAPTPLKPGETYKLVVDLGPVAAQLAAGHRLRVDVSGAYFPLFDRNTNTGEGPFSDRTKVATETVQHAGVHASRVILPCVN